jgi:hypothetical protein
LLLIVGSTHKAEHAAHARTSRIHTLGFELVHCNDLNSDTRCCVCATEISSLVCSRVNELRM